jgi:hypothetical protein
MADPVTVNRGLAQPVTGSDVGLWGSGPINGNFGLLDTIVGGIASIATTGGVTTLNAAQLQCGTISVSGSLAGDAALQFPAVQGWWSIENLTTGGPALFIQAGSNTQVICVPPFEITDIQINGNVVKYRNLGRIGTFIDYAVASVPNWITKCTIPPYLLCDGSAFSAGNYPQLAGLIGANVPDLRGRSRAYLNGGTNRITSAGSGINGDAILSAGGQQNILLVQSHLPTGAFHVTVNDPGHFHDINGGSPIAVGSTSVGSGPSSPGAAGGIVSVISPQTDTKLTGITASVVLNGGAQATFTNMGPTTISGITLIRAG